MTNEVASKVFFIPEAELQGRFSIIRLKHPKSNSAVLCALDSSNKLYEVIHFKEEFSSWFVENSVIQDGRIFLMTIVDPLFFILPYVNKDGKFCPLEDLLVDENFPDIHYLSKCCSTDELLNVFESKDAVGYKVFCYNNTKTLHWLQKKVDYASSCLKSNDINITDGSKAASLQTDDDKENPEVLQNYACHLISDYLSKEHSIDLFKSLGLQLKLEKPISEDLEGKSKKQNTCESPTDDYSKKYLVSSAQEKQKAKLSAAQKQLLKVDKKGMKTISSFFLKK
ncbi:ribonuclease H2 subunit B [Nephila pilipes]|uniref:Ribonuclease H2 subunit B n=1 Tax=Nephila pilipes TaxID=299642 RepID=A0A8X6NL61_NEPPI|nr:ribonuclease H2 subunit B [Nephila pilipes]